MLPFNLNHISSLASLFSGFKGLGITTGLNAIGLSMLKKEAILFGKKEPNFTAISSQLNSSSGCFIVVFISV